MPKNNVNTPTNTNSKNTGFSYDTNVQNNNQDFNDSVNRALDQTKEYLQINRRIQKSNSSI